MNQIKILIADDHPMIRHGIKSLLIDEPGMGQIDEATNGMEVLAKLKKGKYDLVIMDIKMPEMNGIEATREIKRLHPNVKVLAISMFDEHSYIIKILRAGAKGYILKNTGKDELLSAIKAVMKGESYFSQEVSGVMMNQLVSGRSPSLLDDEVEAPIITLTNREKQIIKLIAEELTNVEIGKRLGISPRTVDTHRRNLLQKLDVKNTAGLVRYAITRDLLS